jgi:hypothetical protein
VCGATIKEKTILMAYEAEEKLNNKKFNTINPEFNYKLLDVIELLIRCRTLLNPFLWKRYHVHCFKKDKINYNTISARNCNTYLYNKLCQHLE